MTSFSLQRRALTLYPIGGNLTPVNVFRRRLGIPLAQGSVTFKIVSDIAWVRREWASADTMGSHKASISTRSMISFLLLTEKDLIVWAHHSTFLYIFSTLYTFFDPCLILQSCLTSKSLVQSSSEILISKRVVSTHVQEFWHRLEMFIKAT